MPKLTSRSKILTLVDADSLLYLAGAIGEVRRYSCVLYHPQYDEFIFRPELDSNMIGMAIDAGWQIEEREVVQKAGPVEHCLQVAKMKMRTMQERYGDRMEVYIKGEGNFREEVATLHPYKGNRAAEKPVNMPAVKQYLVDNWGAIEVHGKEADDMVATRAYEASIPYVVCSPDKDLDQIPGLHWNYRSNVEYNITKQEAEDLFWQQVLSGDSSDNIKGCWKIGLEGAAKLVESYREEGLSDAQIWDRIIEEYEFSMGKTGCPYAGMPPDIVALENARLVWMQTEHGKLWTPPGTEPEYLEDEYDY